MLMHDDINLYMVMEYLADLMGLLMYMKVTKSRAKTLSKSASSRVVPPSEFDCIAQVDCVCVLSLHSH